MFTKLSTLNKDENKSEWQKLKLVMEPHQYQHKEIKLWGNNEYAKQIVPGMPKVYGKLTKREQNGYLFQQKVNQANYLFNYYRN
jgi:hypothetical protein